MDETERAVHLTAHAAAIKNHVNALGNKAYWAQFDDAPDYVVMFIPGEHFLAAALEQDSKLWDFAFERRVLAGDANQPDRHCPDGRGRLAAGEAGEGSAADRRAWQGTVRPPRQGGVRILRKVGAGLSSAVNNYNHFVASFEKPSLW